MFLSQSHDTPAGSGRCGWPRQAESPLKSGFLWSRFDRSPQAVVASMALAGRTVLKPTPEQEPAWNRFVATLRTAATSIGEARDNLSAAEDAAAPERISRLQGFAESMAAGLDYVRPALVALYEVLDPDQRESLDRLIAGRGHPLLS